MRPGPLRKSLADYTHLGACCKPAGRPIFDKFALLTPFPANQPLPSSGSLRNSLAKLRQRRETITLYNSTTDTEIRSEINKAIAFYNSGDLDSVATVMRHLIDHHLVKDHLDASSQDLVHPLITLLEVSGNQDAVLPLYRKMCHASNTPPYMFSYDYFRYLENSAAPAELADFTTDLAPSDLARTILVACMPKSGSTFLSAVLGELLGYPRQRLCLSYTNEENVLFVGKMVTLSKTDKIAQEHCKASSLTLAQLQAFNVETVVLVRNIYDALVSMRDMAVTKGNGSVTAWFHQDLPNLDDETVLDAVIAKWAHWYVEFFVSWFRATRDDQVKADIWRYEDIMADKTAAVRDMCQHLDISAPVERITQTIEALEGDRNRSRINVGISGRGLQVLSPRQVEYVQSLTRFYPDVDFTALGLGS